MPFRVGWSKDPAKPGFAWTDRRNPGFETAPAEALRFGFDLAKVEPLGAIKGADYLPAQLKLGDWSLEFVGKAGAKDDGVRGQTQLKQAASPSEVSPP